MDKLHPRLAGPLGGAEEQHTELLQVSGRDGVRLSRFPLPQQSCYHCEYWDHFRSFSLCDAGGLFECSPVFVRCVNAGLHLSSEWNSHPSHLGHQLWQASSVIQDLREYSVNVYLDISSMSLHFLSLAGSL